MRKAPILQACDAQRAATLARLAALDQGAWRLPCLPGWTVHDVVAHLVSIDEAAVRGRLLPVLLRAPDRRSIEHWNDQAVLAYRDRTPGELLAELDRWGRSLSRLARIVPAVVTRIPVRGPFGRQPLLYLLYRRVLDEWVHEHDIALATTHDGVPGTVATPRPEVAAALTDTVLAALPHLVLPRIARRVGVLRLVVDPDLDDGPGPRVWGVDFARRQYGPRVRAEPDATIRLDPATLALLAEGRVEPHAPDGRVTVDGDSALAAAFLEALPPDPTAATRA